LPVLVRYPTTLLPLDLSSTLDISRENLFLDTFSALNYALELEAANCDPESQYELDTPDDLHYAVKRSHLPQSPCAPESKHIADITAVNLDEQLPVFRVRGLRARDVSVGANLNGNSCEQLLGTTGTHDPESPAEKSRGAQSTRSQPAPQTRLQSRSCHWQASVGQLGSRSVDHDSHSEPAVHR
jgi:hypothetical protein